MADLFESGNTLLKRVMKSHLSQSVEYRRRAVDYGRAPGDVTHIIGDYNDLTEWAPTGATIANSGDAGVYSRTTATDRITCTVGEMAYINSDVGSSMTSANYYRVRAFIKQQGDSEYVRILLSATGGSVRVKLNLDSHSATIVNQSGCTATTRVEELANGWIQLDIGLALTGTWTNPFFSIEPLNSSQGREITATDNVVFDIDVIYLYAEISDYVTVTSLSATYGKKNYEVEDRERFRVWRTSFDFTFQVADLVDSNDVAIIPQAGDVIRITIGSTEYDYKVQTLESMPAYQFSDPYQTVYRVHTQLIGEAA